MPVVERNPDELEDGDHAFVLRHDFVFGDPGRYLYAHHGIYCSEQKRFISFTLTSMADPNQPHSESGWLQEGLVRARQGALTALDFAKSFKDYSVVYEPVESFYADKATKRIKIYQYNVEVDFTDIGEAADGRNPDEDTNGQRAVDFAQYFRRNAKGRWFGRYSFRDWNCETFATFCKTAKVSVDFLDAYRAQSTLTGEDPFPRDLLQSPDVSNARSIQAERFLQAGGIFRKRTEESDEPDARHAMVPDVTGLLSEFTGGFLSQLEVFTYPYP